MALDDREEREAVIPGYEAGGVVRETGIALVHEGEWILPAPGSAARLEPSAAADSGRMEYHFPVEVVVRGGLTEEDRAELERRVFGALAEAIERLG